MLYINKKRERMKVLSFVNRILSIYQLFPAAVSETITPEQNQEHQYEE